MPNAAEQKLRIDKWLWFARVAKTRTLAKKLVTNGKIRVDSNKISSASSLISCGQVLTITLERQILIYEIVELGTSRGPYIQAQLLYSDLSPKIDPVVKDDKAFMDGTIATEGRPDKRQRRQLQALKQENML
ncbi:MAG: RNA-binding S4 domain-containing protein [Rhizobiaceae bacterium]|nr:RNA-binding S4 domain-containing protein [Rhizobiaceae bacterium]MBL4695768.1 RNA-binding S4 domain-containing protein [Rhizobiaceae bacterium]